MSVITISRGTMSGGRLIAENLARELGYRCIDRDTIVEKAAARGVSQNELREALEKPPSFLERFGHKKYIYLALIQAALTDEVRNGKAIYHGHAGHLLLRGGGPVLRVRIIAPMDYRIAMAQQRLKFSREEAISYIQAMDEHRRKWTQYLYGVAWQDASLYDLVINLENVDIKEATDTIAYLAKNRTCYEFDDRCRAQMEDLAIASRVKADLALNGPTSHLEFDVTCAGGKVMVAGKLPAIDLVEDVQRIASSVPGVKEVVVDRLVTLTPA